MASYVWKHPDDHLNVDSISWIYFPNCWDTNDCLKRIWNASVLEGSKFEEYLCSHQIHPSRDLKSIITGESMISEYSTISSIDLDISSSDNPNSLLLATEWTMMIATWVKKGVFR